MPGDTIVGMSGIALREVRADDLALFHEYENDPEAVRRSAFPPRELDAFLTHWRTTVLADPTVFVRAITVEGETAGSVVTWWAGEDRYLGYWLGSRFWGRGVGTEALRLFLEAEPVRPLWADPAAANTASVRLLRRHGFRPVRTVRHGENDHVVLRLDQG